MQKNVFFALLILLSAAFTTTINATILSPNAPTAKVMKTNDKEAQMGEIVVFAGQEVSFHLALQSNETATVKLYDSFGRLLSVQQVKAKQKGLTEVSFPTHPNKKGIFIIESSTNAGLSYLRVTVK